MDDGAARGAERQRVVVNQEGQFALWMASREIPPGWSDAGKEGSREECLAYVEQVWTDMRPLSLRERSGDPA
jgi:MbtH protein